MASLEGNGELENADITQKEWGRILAIGTPRLFPSGRDRLLRLGKTKKPANEGREELALQEGRHREAKVVEERKSGNEEDWRKKGFKKGQV